MNVGIKYCTYAPITITVYIVVNAFLASMNPANFRPSLQVVSKQLAPPQLLPIDNGPPLIITMLGPSIPHSSTVSLIAVHPAAPEQN